MASSKATIAGTTPSGAPPPLPPSSNSLHMLSGLLCGLTVLPLNPPRPVSAALIVGLTVVLASTLLFDPRGRETLLVKFALWLKGSAMMVVGRDKKWKKKGRPDPARVKKAKDKKAKRLIFVRHGESTWNLIFNVGPKVLVPMKALIALVKEVVLVLRLDPNSVFYDSPLNESGLAQARDLSAVLQRFDKTSKHYGDVAAMLAPAYAGRLLPPQEPQNAGNANGDVDTTRKTTTTSVVTTSNLRRAAQTAMLALRSRLEAHPNERVVVLSALQEISTNIDTLSLTPPLKAPVLPDVPPHLCDASRFDASANSGNKLLRGNGLQRMQAFAEWAFKREEDVVIVAGHSLFFRAFFREFLPVGANPFDARDVKIHNGGVVALTLERGTVGDDDAEDDDDDKTPASSRKYGMALGAVQYRVDPDSIAEIHLGFELSKQKKRELKAAAKKQKVPLNRKKDN